MDWNALVNKWFLGAFTLCVICCIGCFLWYQNDIAKMQQEIEAHNAFLAHLESEKKSR